MRSWLATDGENGEIQLDSLYSLADFHPDSVQEAEKVCSDFTRSNAADLAASGLDDAQVGHNLWLTRNRHGSGFWDRGLGAAGQRLTDMAHVYGETDVYLGDDGKLHTE